MNLAANLGGMFIVQDVNVCVPVQIKIWEIMDLGRQTGYQSHKFIGRVRSADSLFTFSHGHALTV